MVLVLVIASHLVGTGIAYFTDVQRSGPNQLELKLTWSARAVVWTVFLYIARSDSGSVITPLLFLGAGLGIGFVLRILQRRTHRKSAL